MDFTKFRPNMVVASENGEEVAQWEEDFWGELLVGHDKRIILTENCARCTSINVRCHSTLYLTSVPLMGN